MEVKPHVSYEYLQLYWDVLRLEYGQGNVCIAVGGFANGSVPVIIFGPRSLTVGGNEQTLAECFSPSFRLRDGPAYLAPALANNMKMAQFAPTTTPQLCCSAIFIDSYPGPQPRLSHPHAALDSESSSWAA